jgi:aspartate/methionine/tyrosine aminotransferase
MTRISRRAAEIPPMALVELLAAAQSRDTYDIALGIPPGDPPPEVVEAAVAALTSGHNQYAPPEGLLAVRERIAEDLLARRGVLVDPVTEVTVTCGATEGVLDALLAVTDPGDEVLVVEPCYETYPGVIGLAGAVAVPVPLTGPGWRLDLDRLAAAVTPRTRAILLNSPHNPTGRVFDAAEVRGILDLCVTRDLVCVTDETYERYVYDGVRHVSPLGLSGAEDHVIVTGSLSKSLRMSGWRVGYVVAAAGLSAAVRQVHERTTIGAARPLQQGVAAFRPGLDTTAEVAEFQRRRDHLVSGLRSLGFAVTEPEGGWFVLAGTGPLGYRSDRFAADLLAATGVLVAPGAAFFSDGAPGLGLVRTTFVRDRDRTVAALARIGRFLDEGRFTQREGKREHAN